MKRAWLVFIWVVWAAWAPGADMSFADNPDPASAVKPKPLEKPLWEINLFGGATRIPIYRGSKSHNHYILPLPFLVYRGESFQSDREGIRGVFARSDHFEINLSFFGNPPADDDGTARENMGDLEVMVEMGPRLKWYPLGRRADSSFYLSAALHAAASADLPSDWRFQYRGWRYLTYVNYLNHAPWGDANWDVGVRAGLDFAGETLHDYFYTVPRAHVTPERPAYQAKGGYHGLTVSSGISRKISDNFTIGVFGAWDSQAGAVYRDSPLVETENNFTIAAALVWTFMRSKQLVRDDLRLD